MQTHVFGLYQYMLANLRANRRVRTDMKVLDQSGRTVPSGRDGSTQMSRHFVRKITLDRFSNECTNKST